MLEYYEKLLTLKCFSHKDAMKLFGDARRTTNILYGMKKKGLIQSIRRDYYVVVSLESRTPVAEPFEIASHISENSYISHHSAFEFYGAAIRISPDVYVSSEKRFREFEFGSCRYCWMAAQNLEGITRQGMVRVTDREQTVLDGIRDFEKTGGLTELLQCLGRIQGIREEKLSEYLERSQNRFLFQKTGYLLSYFPQLGLSETFFAYCRQNKGKSSRYLVSGPGKETCVYLREWNLCVPVRVEEKLASMQTEVQSEIQTGRKGGADYNAAITRSLTS